GLEQNQLDRLNALYDLMRMELPAHLRDIDTNPIAPNPGGTGNMAEPSLHRAYKRKRVGGSPEYQGAECLYMILTMGMGKEGVRSGDASRIAAGDYDNDGLPEFHDAWGRPISFLRWAPGFISDAQPAVLPEDNPSPFDPLGINVTATTGQRLIPLIYSAGPDQIYDIGTQGGAASYDPYQYLNRGLRSDQTSPFGGPNGRDDSIDNIHNHNLDAR
ncbi:MAG: hypothetical protein N2C14_20160, partial [Planctomycetales bacterium]